MTRAAPLPLLLLATGCAIPEPPRSPDPIEGGARLEGTLRAEASAAQAAFCVSQRLPLSRVVLIPDGAAVRPVSAAAGPDYALALRRSEGDVTWLRQVGEGEPSEVAVTAYRLDGALAGCAPGPGDPA